MAISIAPDEIARRNAENEAVISEVAARLAQVDFSGLPRGYTAKLRPGVEQDLYSVVASERALTRLSDDAPADERARAAAEFRLRDLIANDEIAREEYRRREFEMRLAERRHRHPEVEARLKAATEIYPDASDAVARYVF